MSKTRIQQVKSILELTSEAFQASINESLKKIGDDVISIDIMTPMIPGKYAAFIVYWADVSTA